MAYDNTTAQSTVPSVATGDPHPMLTEMSKAMQLQNNLVQQANAQVQRTAPTTISTGETAPQLPKTAMNILGGASANNVARQQVYTREGARNKAIGQIAGAAGAFVSAIIKKKQAQETQALAQDIHRSMELQDGITQAQEIIAQTKGATDPQSVAMNKQAQQVLLKNSTLMKSLLAGKNGKKIGEAYDITFGPGANQKSAEEKSKSIPHQAAQMAMKQFKQDQAQGKGESLYKQFEAQQPASIASNPAYAGAMANLKATQENAQRMATIYERTAADVNKTEVAEDATRERWAATQADNANKMNIAQMNERANALIEQTKLNQAAEIARQRNATTLKAAGIRANASLNQRGLVAGYQDTGRQITNVNNHIASLTTQLDALKNKAAAGNYDPQVTALEGAIKQAQGQLKDLQDRQSAIGKSLNIPESPTVSAYNSIMSH